MKTLLISATLFSFAITATQAQDYSNYNTLLKKYANKSGVKYKAWSNNAEDKEALTKLLKDWSKVKAASLGKKDRAAFRINLYNATIIKVALEKYPIKSVTKIGAAFSVFKKNHVLTSDGKISLNTLEKKQLLKDFPDYRLHFAVNCASASCPPLRSEAFVGDKLEQQLEEQSKAFAISKHAVVVSGKTAKYSKLFDWYKKDFGTSNPAKVLNKYRDNKLSTSLRVKWQEYDWALNEAK